MDAQSMAGHLIRRLHQQSTQVFTRRIQEAGFDLTPVQFAAMDAITKHPGIDQAGMPLSMQLVGPRLGEAVLVRAGHAYQTVTDWHCRHPAIG